MRAAVAFLTLGLLGALTAIALPHPGDASNPKLIGTVGPGYTIALTDADGTSVTSLPAGTYDIEVHDNATIHNFHLFGPGSVDESTNVAGTGQVTWTVTLVAGTYTYQCDPHADSGMRATFTVVPSGTTSTPTTGTPTTATGPRASRRRPWYRGRAPLRPPLSRTRRRRRAVWFPVAQRGSTSSSAAGDAARTRRPRARARECRSSRRPR